MISSWVCLMYHDLRPERDYVTGGSGFFAVTPESFAHQLALLRDHGWRGCSIADVQRGQSGKHIAISFDDGSLGQARFAFPALARAGMSATFFVTTSWVNTRGYASWEQLREMRAAGMAIESHTHTHPFLSELSQSALRDELARSRDAVGEHLGIAPTMLALPGGDAPRSALCRLFAEEGYRVVATSRWGVNARYDSESGPPLTVRRCTIRGEMSDEQFLAIVNSDRWLAVRKSAREGALRFIRRVLGPTRYAQRRRAILNAAGALRR